MIECKVIYNVYPTDVNLVTSFYIGTEHLIATRIIESQLCKVEVQILGLDDLINKHTKFCKLDNELFKLFANIGNDEDEVEFKF